MPPAALAFLTALIALSSPVSASTPQKVDIVVDSGSGQLPDPRYLNSYPNTPSYDSRIIVTTKSGSVVWRYSIYLGIVDGRGATAPAPMIVARVDEGADGTWDVVLFEGSPPNPTVTLPYTAEYTVPVALEVRADDNEGDGDYDDVDVILKITGTGITVEWVSVSSGVTPWLEVKPLTVNASWDPAGGTLSVGTPPAYRFSRSTVSVSFRDDGTVVGVDAQGNPSYYDDPNVSGVAPPYLSNFKALVLIPAPENAASVELQGSFVVTRTINDGSQTLDEGTFDVTLQPGSSVQVTGTNQAAQLTFQLEAFSSGYAILLITMSADSGGSAVFSSGDRYELTFSRVVVYDSSGNAVEIPPDRVLTLAVIFGGAPGDRASVLPFSVVGLLALARLLQRSP